MPKTITKDYIIYTYQELSEGAQEKVRSSFGEHDAEFETEWLDDYFKEKLADDYPYFTGAKFEWSCSSSQGDGLSFSCDIDLNKFLEMEYPKMKRFLNDIICDEISLCSTGNTGHCCYASENQIDESGNNLNDYPKIDAKITEVIEAVKEKYTDICQEFYTQAQNTYDNLYSNEYAQETCDANEYTFLEDGTMFNT